MLPAPLSEKRLLWLLGAVQLVNVVDFVMVLPLGPDFARALDIPTHLLGLVAGSYTAAAAVAGLLASSILDRFDRRSALLVTLLGLVVGTALGAAATGVASMLFARVVAGAFGGPATSLAMSILTDAVPPERRGRAMGKVMGAFSIASVIGIPAGLELARLGGWYLPFIVIAALGVLVALAVWVWMPPMRAHLAARGSQPVPRRPLREFLTDRLVALALIGTAVAMAGTFALISNLSTFVQFNLGFPRDQLGLMYMLGGAVTFFTMRLTGRAVDRWGSTRVVALATALVVGVITLAFLPERPLIPVVAIFIGFMLANTTRMIGLNALTTRVPPLAERARFMSMQNAVSHTSTSAGAVLSTWVLHERADGSLEGMATLALGAAALAVMLPPLVGVLAARVRARDVTLVAPGAPVLVSEPAVVHEPLS
jgi:predicted MFS family arabinose efflux permease